MRGIKFRAWSHVRAEYLTVEQLTWFRGKGPFVTNKPALMKSKDGIYHGDIIEQYTGLKDKNGREIYEGDIVEFDVAAALGEPEVRHQKGPVVVGDRLYDVTIGTWNACYTKDYVVIGNIHENPELLK